jgi:hypothetical protein
MHAQSLFLGSFCLQFLALCLVLLLPVILLAVSSAVEGLLARTANLVLSKIALRCTAEAALFHKVNVLLAFLRHLGIFLQLFNVLKPLLGSIMHPRVDEGKRFTLDMFLR